MPGGNAVSFSWFEYLGLILAFGVVVVVPGADFAMVLRQSVQSGRRAALFTSTGVAASILVHGTYTLLGVGVIVGHSMLAFDIIKWIGTAYLVFVAISALRGPAPQPPATDMVAAGSSGDFSAFVLGFLTNLLNPKAVLFFLALFTSLVSATTPAMFKIVYLLTMSVMLMVWFSLVSVFFTVPAVRQGFFRLGRWFNRVTGLTFLLLAIQVAVARQH